MKAGVYQHYKGQQYFVLGSVRHSETEEPMVLYYPLYGDAPQYWARPAGMFCEHVEVGAESVPRFKLVREATVDEAAALASIGPLGRVRRGKDAT